MIEIKKGKEPKELIQYRKQNDATYDNMHGARVSDQQTEDVYHIVLNSLVREQGGLCAYCMCRIPERKGTPSCTIEHIVPQSECKNNPEKAIDYRNMLAVCSGNRNATSDADKTCDARRKNQKLNLNPLDKSTLKWIKYKSDGRIFSDDAVTDKELDDVLNLNCISRQLPDCRKKALEEMLLVIKKKYPSGSIKEYCLRLLDHYRNDDPKKPYVGILIYWLERHCK